MKFIFVILLLINSTLGFVRHPIKISNNLIRLYSNKRINGYLPKSSIQEEYLNYMENIKYKMIIANGPAGTGKTLLACQTAIKQLIDRDIEKIIITRPIVPVEEDIGFLPGTINKKMDPWTRPIMDIFSEFQSKNDLKNLIRDNTIEISPLGFMRGRTFKNAVVIADEMQNCSPNQMLMLLTRLGENSKIIITGDLKQCDKDFSGLQDLLERLKLYYDTSEEMENDGIAIINFKNENVERSYLVKKILDIYNQ